MTSDDTVRATTREIATGDLSTRVVVTTSDEIEGLARDFNTMTERLAEARERLSAWNVKLECEVARQADRLHTLQSGLARADKMSTIGQMTAAVMHEVGNPLAAIKTKIQVAEEDSQVCAECRALLAELVREVDRLATFLRSFSRLARLREPVFTMLSLSEVTEGVVALVTPELRGRGVALRFEPVSEVPSIRGDADQLRQLLVNLILNAAEASPRGGQVLVRIRAAARAGEDAAAPGRATVEVADHGAGIPANILDKIWDPFFTTKPEGTGLGLAISRRIVEDHGGTIEVRSAPSSGTVVTLAFPAGLERQP